MNVDIENNIVNINSCYISNRNIPTNVDVGVDVDVDVQLLNAFLISFSGISLAWCNTTKPTSNFFLQT